MSQENMGSAGPVASPVEERPSWAVGGPSFGWGRVLYDISFNNFLGLPGVTKKMALEVDELAEAGWTGVSPKARRFLLAHGVDRVMPL